MFIEKYSERAGKRERDANCELLAISRRKIAKAITDHRCVQGFKGLDLIVVIVKKLTSP